MKRNLPLLIVTLLTIFQVAAQTKTWTGTSSAAWAEANNWNPVGIPAATDDVTIPSAPSNQPILSINTAVAKSVEVLSGATLTIATSGELTINDSKSFTVDIHTQTSAFLNRGTVENSGRIVLGNTAEIGLHGLWNSNIFNNNTGGEINIDKSSVNGLWNQGGTFTNAAKISIGSNDIAGSIGLLNRAIFNNETGGEINIDNTTFIGLHNFPGSTFTNAAKIIIGASESVGSRGFLNNSSTFNNETGGELNIDNATSVGLSNFSGTFTNAATITIGATESVGGTGLDNNSIFNNNTCAVITVLQGNANNTATGNFTNEGHILVASELANSGMFTNDGVLKYGTTTGNAIANSTDASLIVNDDPTPIFTYGGTYDGTIDGIFTDEAATLSAGTFTAPNTFVPSGLPFGSQTLYAKITPNGGACSFVVPFIYISTDCTPFATATDDMTWTGAKSTAWNDPCNWFPVGIPTATNNVIIPSGTPNEPTLSISTAVAKSVEVQDGATFTIATTGQLTINGFLTTVTGSVSQTIGFFNQGTVENNGKLILGNINSVGETGLRNNGTFNNNAGSELSIDNSSSIGLANFGLGPFTNVGKITIGGTAPVGETGLVNWAQFTNNTGGEINIDNSTDIGLENISSNSNDFTNQAKITIGGNASVGTVGLLNRGGVFNNNDGGNISIDGYATVGVQNNNNFFGNFCIINNAGKFAIGANTSVETIGFSNNWQFNNLPCGEIAIANGSTFVSGTRVTNEGYIFVSGEIITGNFTNEGVLKYGSITGNAITNATNSSVIVNDTPTPIFTYGGTYDGTIDGIFTDDAATLSAGTFTAPNTFVPTGLSFGSQTLYAEITPSGGACSYVVPFTYSNTVCTQVATATEDMTWTGAKSTAWDDPCNWSPTGVPTATNNVIIPSGTPNEPTLSVNTAVAKSVEVQSGATFTISTTGQLTINDSKNFDISAFSGTAAFLNEGTVENNGKITLGNTAAIGQYGLCNTNVFNNNSGEINIDNSTGIGLYNVGGTFTNLAKVTIGGIALVGLNGIQNTSGIFNNNLAGEISIDRSSTHGLHNESGTFTNAAKIMIGANNSVGSFGLRNSAAFNNNNSGEIYIDNSVSTGLYNIGGTFTNVAKVTIGGIALVGSNGIRNTSGVFNNNLAGEISIDRSSTQGLQNESGTFTNAAKIMIGANNSVGSFGLRNSAAFDNNVGGEVNIDNSSISGLYNIGGTFTNVAKVTIGSIAPVGLNGIQNTGMFGNTSGGEIKIDNSSSSGLSNEAGTITNEAKITIGGSSAVGLYGVYNASTLNNSPCAEVLVLDGPLTNVAGKVYTNTGYTLVASELANGGTFTNNGVLKYGTTTGTAITNENDASLIVNDDPTPIFTYGGTYDGTVDGIFTDNAATLSAGTFTAPNTFVPSGLSFGSQTLYAEITPSGGACSYVVPFTYSNTFCTQVATATEDMTWTGAKNTDWNEACNWSPTGVPTATNNVIIPSGTPNAPNLIVTTAVAKSVEVRSGATFSIATSGQLSINGFLSTTIGSVSQTIGFFNQGTVENNGKIILGNTNSVGETGLRNNGTFNNNAGSELSIDNSSSIGLASYLGGTFTNVGKITIGGTASVGEKGLFNLSQFNNSAGGEINIDNSTDIGLENISVNSNDFTNHAKITIGGNASVGTVGLLNRGGVFNNNDGGNISIDGYATVGVQNNNNYFGERCIINNVGKIAIGSNTSAGTIGFRNSWQLNNLPCGEIAIANGNIFDNLFTVTNEGYVFVTDELTNAGTFTNNGVLKYGSTTGTAIVNATNPSVIIQDSPTPIFTFGGTYDGTIDGIFTDDAATLPAGTFTLPNTFVPTGLSFGSQTLYAEITPSGGACSYVVPFAYSNTVCTQVATATEDMTWTGAKSTAWDDPCNWSPTGVPTATNNVIIPSGTPNEPILTISTGVAKSVEVQSGATFTISTTGQLTINDSKNFVGQTASLIIAGTVNNAGSIIIGSTGAIGNYGIRNGGTLNNNAGGVIQIDNSTFAGLVNFFGTVTNNASINIGNNGSSGGDGIQNRGTFNNVAGEIKIDRSTQRGLYHLGGTFTNDAKITIGSITTLNGFGLFNRGATFNNQATGEISIDNTASHGLWNSNFNATAAEFNNSGKIKVGSTALTAPTAILINDPFNNLNCGRVIAERGKIEISGIDFNSFADVNHIYTNTGYTFVANELQNNGTFTNNGVLKYGSTTGNAIVNAMDASVIVNVTPTPIFTFGGTYDGTIDGIFTNETATTSAGTYSQPTNTFTPNGNVVAGSQTLYAKITQNGCTAAQAHVVPFIYNNVVATPEINLTGNGQTIEDDDISPATADHTDFGTLNIYSGSLTRTFTIENTGTATLTLSGQPSLNTGSPHFTISSIMGGGLAIEPSETRTFTVTYNAAVAGTRQDVVFINSDDTDEGTYNFTIGGFGTETCTPVATVTDELTWTGLKNTNWNEACNWSPIGIPTATNDVVIPSGTTNSPTLSINNAVANSVEVQSGATFTIATSGQLTINDSKRFTVGSLAVTTAFLNRGTVANSGGIVLGNNSAIGQIGLWNINIFNNNIGGVISIDRSISTGLANNSGGTFTNVAEIRIGSNAGMGFFGLINEAIFINNSCGRVVLEQGQLFVSSVATYTNEGYIFVANNLQNDGPFTNDGVLKYGTTAGTAIVNATNPSVIIQDSPSPIFTFGGTYDGTIDGIFTDDAATLSAGTYDLGTNAFTPDPGLTLGSQTLYAKVTQDGCTAAHVVPFVYNNLAVDADLSALTTTAGALDPAFASATTAYTVTVDNLVTSITVTPTPTDANATITVNSTAVSSGVASDPVTLNEGANTITVEVTAEDGVTVRAYTITVTRSTTCLSTPAPTGLATQVYAGTGTLADLSVSGTGVIWYDASENGNVLPLNTPLTDEGAYYASQTLNTCESTNRLAVNSKRISDATQSLCPGSTIADLISTPSSGATVAWYATATSSSPLLSSELLNSGSYFVEQTGSNRVEVSVEFFREIETPRASPLEFNDIFVCVNQPAEIGLYWPNSSSYSFKWQISTGGEFTDLTESAVYSNVTNDTLKISQIAISMEDNQYRAIVSNACFSVSSDTFKLKVGTNPQIISQPISQFVCLNNEAVLEVGVNGAGVAYHWQIDNGAGFQNVSGSEYNGVNSKKLIISNFDSGKSGKPFRCLVSTNCFQVISDPATITLSSDFVIFSEPANQTTCEFGSAQFVFQAIKLTPGSINYQWQRKVQNGTWVDVNNGGRYAVNDSVLVINNVPVSWNNFEFRCLMNNSCQSKPAKLNIIPVAHVTKNPGNQEVCVGNNASFTIKAVGQGLTYRWQVNNGAGFSNILDGGIYQGATTETLRLSFPSATVNNYQYRCVVSGTSTCDIAADTSGVGSISIGVSPEAQVIFWNSDIASAVPITQAVGYILAINSILQPDGKAEYRAGNSITLNPGFEVEAGAVFLAKIMNPCQNVTTTNNLLDDNKDSKKPGKGGEIPKELVK